MRGSKILALLVLLTAMTVFAGAAHADFIQPFVPTTSQPDSVVEILGFVKLTNGTGIEGYNISGTFNTTNWSLTSPSGAFGFNVTTPSSSGDYNVSFSTNNSLSKSVPTHVTDMTSANISFIGSAPPFENGTTFTINVTTAGTLSITPIVEIFEVGGGEPDNWTVTNTTSVINVTNMQYDITSPAEADGTYVIVFEEGLAFEVFVVKSSLRVVADITGTSNSTSTTFAPGGTVRIFGKVRNLAGPITGASVTAFITLPNSTARNLSLSHSVNKNGTYFADFTETSLSGSYKVRLEATSGSRKVESFSSFSTNAFEAKLDVVSDFFFEFGSSSGFQAGGQVAFNVLVFNTSDGSVFDGAADGGGSKVNCNTLSVISLKNKTGSPVSGFDTENITGSVGDFFGQDVCKINFTAPSENGLYRLTINASVGAAGDDTNATATGFFNVANYVMKVQPVSSIGGGFEFMTFLLPGDNATFEISVRNLSDDGAAVTGSQINSSLINATRLIPMNFLKGAQQDITALKHVSVTAGTASANPKLELELPQGEVGPFQLEATATVDGQELTGTAFYFAKYVNGFAFPPGSGGPGGEGGEGGEGGGESTFQCSGTQNFQATVFDVKTNQAARNVVFNKIQSARSESTGEDVTSSLTLNSSTLTNSNGQANLSITFSSAKKFSGFHFMLINVTTNDGKNDEIFGGFECNEISFDVSVQAEGAGSGGFFVGPSDTLSVSVSSIKNKTGQTVTNGTVNVIEIETFSSRGPSFTDADGTISYEINNQSNVAFNLTPGNFSLSKWNNGFSMLIIEVCDRATGSCGESDGFFKSEPFTAFVDFSSFGGSSVFPGENVTYTVLVRSNVTWLNSTTSNTVNFTTTQFKVQMGQPWAGSLTDATNVNGTLIYDGWNHTTDTGFDAFEKWNVSFTVPTAVRQGGNMIIIKIENNQSQTTEAETFTSVQKFSVTVPDEEGVFMDYFKFNDGDNWTAFNASVFGNLSISLDELNFTYNTTTKSGFVCGRVNLTAESFGPSGGIKTYSNTTNLLVVDNETSGVYDTLVINKSGTIEFASINDREFNEAGFSGLYLRQIEDCGFVSVLNSTVAKTGFGSGYGGQHQKNQDFYLPFIVKRGTAALPGVTMNVTQVIKQQTTGDTSGRGGFGFDSFVTKYNVTADLTDSNGVAFIRMNFNDSGSVGLIWKANTTAESSTADFFDAIQAEVKLFKAWGGVSTFTPKVVTLNNATDNYSASSPGYSVYFGTYSEIDSGELFNSTETTTYNLVLRNVTREGTTDPFTDLSSGFNFTELVIDDDINLSSEFGGDSTPVVFKNWTERFEPADMGPGDTIMVDGNLTVNDAQIKLVFGADAFGFDKFLSNDGSSNRVHDNVTVRVCAKTYDQPEKPVIGAAINLTTEDFSGFGPPTSEPLTMFSPYNSSAVGLVYTGPSGCATFNVTRSGGWKSGFPNNIQGTINRTGDIENVFAGMVSVACPSSGSCFE